jgi:DNA-directed RNA polymerase I subunit RPA1
VSLKDNHKINSLTEIISKWIEIQDSVNSFYDSTKALKASEKDATGIKQLLEKKEGLFRMKMMGKRYVFILLILDIPLKISN